MILSGEPATLQRSKTTKSASWLALLMFLSAIGLAFRPRYVGTWCVQAPDLKIDPNAWIQHVPCMRERHCYYIAMSGVAGFWMTLSKAARVAIGVDSRSMKFWKQTFSVGLWIRVGRIVLVSILDQPYWVETTCSDLQVLPLKLGASQAHLNLTWIVSSTLTLLIQPRPLSRSKPKNDYIIS
jgi:hypothetical protein